MTERRTSHTAANKIEILVLSCFFLSGLTALVYEILWTEMVVFINEAICREHKQ